ncbi:MAG: hypothetical protein GC154_00050 [bacterium]|nr:hypothetical protein [bacterium]
MASALLLLTPALSGAATFGEDVAFLNKHIDVIVLNDGAARVAVAPAYQGRVMTSSASGNDGISFGWINHDLIKSGEFIAHINPFGGEDRFWLGPEGGQFSIFFRQGDQFNLQSWQTPPYIDSQPFTVTSKSDTEVHFQETGKLINKSGTRFTVQTDRTVRLISRDRASQLLGVEIPDSVNMVCYESENTITNKGDKAWTKDTGLLSIWILGMYNPSPETTVAIPFQTGSEDQLGPVVNDAYFGKVPADRLRVGDGVMFFSGDGKYRSKIGLNPLRAKPFFGSYDAANKALTIVNYTKPEGVTDYVNSMWELQEHPYAGDAINSYNDGPPGPGKKPLGPFYELETSSPAAALAPGESFTHVHRTCHLTGPEEALNAIAKAKLGADLQTIQNALK